MRQAAYTSTSKAQNVAEKLKTDTLRTATENSLFKSAISTLEERTSLQNQEKQHEHEIAKEKERVAEQKVADLL